MPESPSWSVWSDIDGGTVDGRILTHTELDYSKGYRYRYKAVNTSGNESSWSDPSSGDVPLKSGQQDIAYRSLISEHIETNSLKAEVYEEIRNVLPWNFTENLDQSYPLPIDFHIPTETVNIKKILVTAKADSFRTYSKGSKWETNNWSFWGTEGVVLGTTNGHQLSLSTEDDTDFATGFYSESPQTYTNDFSADEDTTHYHRYENEYGSIKKLATLEHYHTITDTFVVGINNLNTHRHNIDMTKLEHTHPIDFGIYRDIAEYDGEAGINVEVYIDDGDGFPGTADYTLTTDANGVVTEELDIMADGKITQIPEDPETYDSWFKRIEFRIPTGTGQPERLRISGQLIAKIDITA
jgi:hypothetical protein